VTAARAAVVAARRASRELATARGLQRKAERERDIARAERDAARCEVDELRTERDAARCEVNELHLAVADSRLAYAAAAGRADRHGTEVVELTAQLDELVLINDGLDTENDWLRAKLQEDTHGQ
jgi:uncharacterized protein (DUF3084 family)